MQIIDNFFYNSAIVGKCADPVALRFGYKRLPIVVRPRSQRPCQSWVKGCILRGFLSDLHDVLVIGIEFDEEMTYELLAGPP